MEPQILDEHGDLVLVITSRWPVGPDASQFRVSSKALISASPTFEAILTVIPAPHPGADGPPATTQRTVQLPTQLPGSFGYLLSLLHGQAISLRPTDDSKAAATESVRLMLELVILATLYSCIHLTASYAKDWESHCNATGRMCENDNDPGTYISIAAIAYQIGAPRLYRTAVSHLIRAMEPAPTATWNIGWKYLPPDLIATINGQRVQMLEQFLRPVVAALKALQNAFPYAFTPDPPKHVCSTEAEKRHCAELNLKHLVWQLNQVGLWPLPTSPHVAPKRVQASLRRVLHASVSKDYEVWRPRCASVRSEDQRIRNSPSQPWSHRPISMNPYKESHIYEPRAAESHFMMARRCAIVVPSHRPPKEDAC
ncbi:uncharacterized protein B0I36DRAFT_357391 [Microdochium trichocladiopsis]|uniref:BTB domain-containing protein n=1 Tax=Microdochium trichocladiopsis TaxID=1682393 RepID=A0A9P9BTI9_9PEZI|nr:uncharacterized protein B0I36DRAFT_357391 [Microdochium trichocladiopsis]KAH7040031.1 hypothetical protein B0I36DRAFT_357391 [Microdochium trichocladiopsis]